MPDPPFLPVNKPETPEYCLVIDLDETLVHYNEKEDYFMVRPGVAPFLNTLKVHYELVLWTASVKKYADWILDSVDPAQLMGTRLYRNHCTLKKGMYVKDLTMLGRDLFLFSARI